MAKKIPGATQSAATQRIQRTEAYAGKVKRMFDETVNDILKLKLAKPTEEGVMYSFDGDSLQVRKQVEYYLKRLHASATLAVKKGIQAEWGIANREMDNLVKATFGKKLFESDRFRAWTAHNEDAMNAFVNRTDKGMNLSDRVWKASRQLRDEMEVALTVGMGSGESAASMSRAVRQCLNDPDLMFRRFRYKKGEDENGNPVYGRKWKKKVIVDGKTKWIDYDKDSYIPKGAGGHSRGVYRSAAKNAMRVARTETNMAYRRADYERWQKMDFVLGIRIELSNQHPIPDICDDMQGDYPKNFYFGGWHPHCFCYATPILVSEDEMAKVTEEFMEGRTYVPKGEPILDTPPAFKQWVADNSDRIRNASSLPYWIKDNPQFVDARKGVALTPDPEEMKAQIKSQGMAAKPVRTQEQIDKLLNRRRAELEQFAKDEAYANDIIQKAKEYSQDIDLSRIEDLNTRHQYGRAAEEAKRIDTTIAQIKQDEELLKDLIPNVAQLHQQYSIEELKASYNTIKKTFDAAEKLSLQDKASLLEAQLNIAPNQLIKDTLKKRLDDVKIDINIERIKPEIASLKALSANSPLATFDVLVNQAESYLTKRMDFAAEDILNRIKQYQPLVKRYEDMLAYYKTTPAGMGTAKVDSKIGIALKAAEKSMFQKDKYNDVLKQIELAEKTKATNEANVARRAAKKAKEAAEKAAATQKIDVSKANSIDELEKMLGSDMPVLLKEYRKSIARGKYTDPKYTKEAAEIERKLKEFFDNSAYAHAVDHRLLDIDVDYGGKKGEGLYITSGIPTNLEVNAAGTKARGASWSLKGADYDESRRSWGHWAYGMQENMYGKVAAGKRLQDNDYYRCGTPTFKDKQKAWDTRAAKCYGDCQITLRKENVVATFTYGNSLNERAIPSLVTAPKVCSIDKKNFAAYKDAKYTSHAQLMKGSNDPYIELQYLPRAKDGFISPKDFESITFPSNPSKLISKKALEAWKKNGVDIYYADSKGKVVLFQKGDPLITQAEAKAKLDSMQADLDKWLKDPALYGNKDISFKQLQASLKGSDYISALSEAEKLRTELAEMERREKALEKLIPDVKKWHKQFTIDELEAAHTAIVKQLDWIENRYAQKDDISAVIGKLGRIIGDNATNKKYSTWEVANQAYARKRDELVYKLKKDTIESNLSSLRGFATKDKAFQSMLKDVEAKVAAKSWYEADELIAKATSEMMRLSTGKLQKALKTGDCTRVLFDSEEFTQAKRDAALWFKAKSNTSAAMKKAYKEADAYMSKYAEAMWKNLTEEEKRVMWLYTDGSQYINKEILGTYQLRMKSPWGDFRNGLKDANIISSVIEKSQPLQEAMWMQSAKSEGAFKAMFGIDIGKVKDLDKLVGKEGFNSVFTSCHSASNGYFVKGGNTGDENNIVMNIFMPKGTKGAYLEPFASWGDSKRGLQGASWDGQKQKCAPSDQVEFLLQRGAKFRISKAYVGTDGRWHIDVDLIEQEGMSALKEAMPRNVTSRRIRMPNYVAR